MAWSEEQLLEMMRRFPIIFGKEITYVNTADDRYVINYFEQRLSVLLNWELFMNSPYAITKHSGKGDIESIKLRTEGFGLTKKQCVEIGSFIGPNICYSEKGAPYLDELCTVIILNYISHGYRLFKGDYEIKYTPRTPFSFFKTSEN